MKWKTSESSQRGTRCGVKSEPQCLGPSHLTRDYVRKHAYPSTSELLALGGG